MKKIKKLRLKSKVKKKINKIKKSIKKNPIIRNFGEIMSHLKTLVGENVILYITSFSEEELDKKISSLRKTIYSIKKFKIYGTLEGAALSHYYFLFNPLNQWKYQENTKLPITHNEHLAFLEEDALFDHDNPTMKILFKTSDVDFIENNNEIHLYRIIYKEPEII